MTPRASGRVAIEAGSATRCFGALLAAQCLALAALSGAAARAASPEAGRSAALHALFDERWEALMQAYPAWATETGDHRYGDRLDDASPEARAVDDWIAQQAGEKQ